MFINNFSFCRIMQTVNSDRFIADLINSLIEKTQIPNIVIVGPSTLDRDHSLAYFTDLFSNTRSHLYVVDMPDNLPKVSYGSLATVKRQFGNLRRKHPHLVRPEFVGCDAYDLEHKLGESFADILYDHNSLYHIALDKSRQMSPDEAFNEIIKVYAHALKPSGKMILMDEATDFGWPLWQDVLPALDKDGLQYKNYFINQDIDMSHKFPELTKMRGHRTGIKKARNGIHYECKTMIVAEKPPNRNYTSFFMN